MFQEKYLPHYHFNEIHRIAISAPEDKIYFFVTQLDFSDSCIIRFLFKLRGMPRSAVKGIDGLKNMGFVVLEEQKDQELILGLIGQFWKSDGNIRLFEPAEFFHFNNTEYAKATWNFKITRHSNHVVLETETRILCLNEDARKKFKRYWFLIRPFSGLIRKEILKSIKRNAEKVN